MWANRLMWSRDLPTYHSCHRLESHHPTWSIRCWLFPFVSRQCWGSALCKMRVLAVVSWLSHIVEDQMGNAVGSREWAVICKDCLYSLVLTISLLQSWITWAERLKEWGIGCGHASAGLPWFNWCRKTQPTVGRTTDERDALLWERKKNLVVYKQQISKDVSSLLWPLGVTWLGTRAPVLASLKQCNEWALSSLCCFLSEYLSQRQKWKQNTSYHY